MLNSIAGLAAAGAGVDALAAIAELQGLNVTLLPGKGAGVKNDLAAIRMEDTIVAALNNNAGTITDVKATTSIVDVRASGTITCTSVAAGDTVTVAGRTYTAVANAAAVTDPLKQFSISGSDAADAAALAAAINARESNLDTSVVSASVNSNVVTVTAVAEGTGGNAITLAKTGAPAISGATLANGTATGGISVVGVTNQVILFWFNKK